MRAPDGYVYEVVNVTGPLATHTLIDGEGRQQKRHPLDALRRAGYDGASPAQIKQRHVRHHSTHQKAAPKALKVEWPVIAKASTRAKRRMCANGHYHWGTECMSCRPKKYCPSPCGREVRSRFRTICARCAEGRRARGKVA